MLLFILESPYSYYLLYLLNIKGRDNEGLSCLLCYFGLDLPLVQGISTEPFIFWCDLFSPANTQTN